MMITSNKYWNKFLTPYEFPTIEFLRKHTQLDDFEYKDIKFNNYQYHPTY